MSGLAELETFIAGVERLREMNERVAKEAEGPVLAAVRATADAGQSPDGKPWPEREAGGRALEGAGAAITSSTKGTRVVLTIGPPWVYHHRGAGGSSTTKAAVSARKRTAARQAKSGTASKFHAPQRQIIPNPGEPIPARVNAAIEEAAAKVFRKAMGG